MIYYKSNHGTLYNGDSEVVAKELPDGFVDLLLTDPPYNIASDLKVTKKGNAFVSTQEAWGTSFQDKWDSTDQYQKWLVGKLEALRHTLKKTASVILFLDRKYSGYTVYLLEKKFGWHYRNKIYFEKLNPIPHMRKTNYRSVIEEAVWFTVSDEGSYHFNFTDQNEMKQIFRGYLGRKKTKHPTEKYRWMIDPLILRHSFDGDVVLDPFAGSGTVLKSAEYYNRKWIGIKKELDFCKIIKQRMESIPISMFSFSSS